MNLCSNQFKTYSIKNSNFDQSFNLPLHMCILFDHPYYMWKFSEIRMIFWGTSTIDEETYLCYAELLVKEDKFKIYLSHQDLDEIKTILGKKILFANIDNIYIPISFLNKGSSCEVNTQSQQYDLKIYMLKDKIHKQTKIVKMINERYTLENKDQIQKEVQILHTLNHQNIVQLHEVYSHNKTFWLVMEYFQGKNLLEYMQQANTKLTKLQIKKILFMCLQALHYLKLNNIVHNDIKPGNIMISDDFNVKIIDFGCADQENQAFTNVQFGTVGYFPPEFYYLKEKRNHKSDMYSLGIVFFNMLTYLNLFTNKIQQNLILMEHLDRLIDDLKIECVEKDLLKLMLAKDPKKRIDAATALGHEYFQETII